MIVSVGHTAALKICSLQPPWIFPQVLLLFSSWWPNAFPGYLPNIANFHMEKLFNLSLKDPSLFPSNQFSFIAVSKQLGNIIMNLFVCQRNQNYRDSEGLEGLSFTGRVILILLSMHHDANPRYKILQGQGGKWWPHSIPQTNYDIIFLTIQSSGVIKAISHECGKMVKNLTCVFLIRTSEARWLRF